ncbi:MAG: TRAP transporter small permease [Acinetobacter sp.]
MMIFNRLKLAVDRVIAAFSVTVMVALVVCVVWQVFSRYVLNQPSTLTDELARFLMIWVGLLGAAYTVGAQRHLSIDLLAMSLNKRKQAMLSMLINLLIFAFAGSVIVTGGLKLIDKTLSTSQVSAAMQIPMGYVYIILPLSGAIMMFYALWFIYQGIQQLKSSDQGAI